MHSDNSYDIAIIGGGISSCVFASTHIKNGFDGKIAIIENGRKLGGRSSTRNSFNNIGWELNHGSPNFNICNKTNNHLLQSFIQELLDSKIIESDTSDVIDLKENHLFETRINSDFLCCSNYIPRSSMSELSQKIISKENLNDQVKYFFETLIVKLNYDNNRWILTSKNGNKFKTKFLICSSNLILHKRSLDILKVNQIPLRKAIPENNDKKIDKIINLLTKQDYVQRLTFLIYTKINYCYKDNYKNKFRYFILSKLLEEKFKFERIIFQKQSNNNLGIVIHTKNNEFIEEFFHFQNKDKFKEKILINFNQLFDKSNFINKLNDYQDLSIMIWRASQPSGLAIPEVLQVCENYNIAFCGDWFDFEGFGRIEGAILSALKLSCKINSIS
ncbi:NAD(P)-binding protein [Prochlorococcus sp. AH-716-K03]|nr:NAD(P)-binding protein [Prochlorococcus sp. AH-716-K03]